MQIKQNRILARCLPDPHHPHGCPIRPTCAKSSRTGCGCCACRKSGPRSAWPTSANWTAPMCRLSSAASGTSRLQTSSAWPMFWVSHHGLCSSRPKCQHRPSAGRDRHSKSLDPVAPRCPTSLKPQTPIHPPLEFVTLCDANSSDQRGYRASVDAAVAKLAGVQCSAVAVKPFVEPGANQVATIVLPTDNTPLQALAQTCPRIHLPLSTAAATAEPAATTGWSRATRRVPCATPRPSSAQAAAVNSPICRTGGGADRRHNPMQRPSSCACA